VNAANPAGLIATFEIKFADGTMTNITSDATWLSTTNGAKGWDKLEFDDSTWMKALAETPYGGAPWGKLAVQPTDSVFGPQSAGIPGVVRITYAPKSDSVMEHGLTPGGEYHASCFDPVTDATTEVGPIHADAEGSWSCPPPAGVDHDWVLILKK
jgi:hypothetical protein